MAGEVTHKLSLTFSLTRTPRNIRIASPPEEISNMELSIKPTIKPNAPTNSRIAVSNPNFSKPNLLNSFFMCGEVK